MKQYFQLQYKMLNRHLIDFGILPIIACFLFIAVFIYGSHVFFERYEIALYLYPFLGFSLLFKLSTKDRNDFLQLSFSAKKYKQVRVLENSLLIFPFVIFLSYKAAFLIGLATYVVAICLSFVKIEVNTNFTIPTPFKKYPFEFTEGFRKNFFVFPLAYLLLFMGIKVNNFNLAIFSLLMVFGMSLSYYSNTEKAYFVWMFKLSPKEFLCMKIKTAFRHVSFLTLPMLIALGYFFIDNIAVIVGFQLIGYVYLAGFILAKYSVFPKEISFPVSLEYFISFIFPPFLFLTFGNFYKKAIEQLKTFLDD